MLPFLVDFSLSEKPPELQCSLSISTSEFAVIEVASSEFSAQTTRAGWDRDTKTRKELSEAHRRAVPLTAADRTEQSATENKSEVNCKGQKPEPWRPF